MNRIALFVFIFIINIYNPFNAQDLSKINNKSLSDTSNILSNDVFIQDNKIDILLEKAEENLNYVSNIISWSAMIFGCFTVILIIAGYLGLKEFSNIRKVKSEMKQITNFMKKDLKKYQQKKKKIENNIKDIKNEFEITSNKMQMLIFLTNKGRSSYYKGDLSRAIVSFKKVIEIYPNDYQANCFLAKLFMDQENYKDALNYANNAILIHSDAPDAHTIIGKIHRSMDKFDSSIEAFNKSIRIQASNSNLNPLAYTYYKIGDYENAIKIFKESLAFKRTSSATCGLAKAYIKTGLYTDAYEYFQNAILLAKEEILNGTEYIFPYYNLASSYLVLNKQSECLRIINKALEINRSSANIKEQIFQYDTMNGVENISSNLLNRSIKLFKETLTTIEHPF